MSQNVNAQQPLPAGFLLIDKPAGPTSHDVVDEVRRLLRSVTGQRMKVGHAGTLDPLATGLLVLGVGSATKELAHLVGLDKTYDTIVTLGATSTTDDAEGTKQSVVDVVEPTAAEVELIVQRFVGNFSQVPPAFSAKKQKGVRLYALARAGKPVAPNPHSVTVYRLACRGYHYPSLALSIHCSSGTYVRSLARDIGAALGTGGYVEVLRRTAVGTFVVKEAHPFSALTAELVTAALVSNSAIEQRLRQHPVPQIDAVA